LKPKFATAVPHNNLAKITQPLFTSSNPTFDSRLVFVSSAPKLEVFSSDFNDVGLFYMTMTVKSTRFPLDTRSADFDIVIEVQGPHANWASFNDAIQIKRSF